MLTDTPRSRIATAISCLALFTCHLMHAGETHVTIRTSDGDGADTVIGRVAPTDMIDPKVLDLAGDGNIKNARLIYLRFDLSDVENRINSAKLILNRLPSADQAKDDSEYVVQLYGIVHRDRYVGRQGSDWAAEDLNWQSAPGLYRDGLDPWVTWPLGYTTSRVDEQSGMLVFPTVRRTRADRALDAEFDDALGDDFDGLPVAAPEDLAPTAESDPVVFKSKHLLTDADKLRAKEQAHAEEKRVMTAAIDHPTDAVLVRFLNENPGRLVTIVVAIYANKNLDIRAPGQLGFAAAEHDPALAPRLELSVDTAAPRLESTFFLPGPTGRFPANAVFSAKGFPFHATGDGVTDDTEALQAALDATSRRGVLYLPPGEYVVTQPIIFGTNRTHVDGESRESSIIRLPANTPGFGDPDMPTPVLSTMAFWLCDWREANSANQFRNSIRDLTVEVGAGNPGAVGINFHANNQGAMTDVTVRSLDPEGIGKAGFAFFSPWPGPSLQKNLRVEGFDYGVWAACGQYGLTFEHLSLEGQRVYGIFSEHQMLSMRGVISKNRVPALYSSDWSDLHVLIDSELTSGDADQAAIINVSTHLPEKGGHYWEKGAWSKAHGEHPGLLVRNTTVSGYGVSIRNGNSIGGVEEVADKTISEFVSHPVVTTGDVDGAQSLNLPIEETPEVPWDSLDQWADVTAYGAVPDGSADSTAAIQAALDSGKSTVYFPSGLYRVTDTLSVRGKVRRVIGMEATIHAPGDAFGTTLSTDSKPVWRFENGDSDTVVLERLQHDYATKAAIYIEQATTHSVVLKSLWTRGFRNTVPGKLFIEDVVGGPFLFDQHQVWARQLNCEISDTANITATGGNLWILNYKTEKPQSGVVLSGGGRLEVLGGYLYPSRGADKDSAAFDISDSEASLTYRNQHGIFSPNIRVTEGDDVTLLTWHEHLYFSKYSVKVPLFVHRKEH